MVAPRSCDIERTAEQERSTDERVICSTVLCWIGLLCACCCPVAFRKSDGLAGVWRSSVKVLTVSETEIDLKEEETFKYLLLENLFLQFIFLQVSVKELFYNIDYKYNCFVILYKDTNHNIS